jgi:ABC-type glycerol-3-phosphate transport system substrate-binding protein
MTYKKTLGLLITGCILALFIGGCQRGPDQEITILIRMLDSQKRFLENEIIPRFEARYNTKVNVATFRNAAELKRMLELDQQKNEYSLVKVPYEVTQQLAAEGYMKKLLDIEKDEAYLKHDLREYHPIAREMGKYNDEYYYIPRKLETRILFYRKSKVADAVEKFPTYRDEINDLLQEQNGFGLPQDYTFSEDPNEWDFYDLFVVGYIWSQEEYYGRTGGRIAHRSDRYEGTALFFVDRTFQFGATPDEIISMSGDAVDQTYLWEKAFIDNGLYNSAMWNNRWRGNDIYTAIQDGNVFLSYIQQIDGFNIHGWEEDPGMQPFLEDPSDMGVAVVPRAVSFELDRNGAPVSEGTRRITVGGWWWGVPESAPEARMGYNFARFMTSRGVHVNESAQFGMIPVRRDILSNLSETYDMGWVGDIYETSIEQLQIQIEDSITTVPRVRQYPQIADEYIDAWYSIIDGPHSDVALSSEAIRGFLDETYVPRIQNILGDEFPHRD